MDRMRWNPQSKDKFDNDDSSHSYCVYMYLEAMRVLEGVEIDTKPDFAEIERSWDEYSADVNQFPQDAFVEAAMASGAQLIAALREQVAALTSEREILREALFGDALFNAAAQVIEGVFTFPVNDNERVFVRDLMGRPVALWRDDQLDVLSLWKIYEDVRILLDECKDE